MEEFIKWVNNRIVILEKEKHISPDEKIKIAKGAKAKGLKECINYIDTHKYLFNETLR